MFADDVFAQVSQAQSDKDALELKRDRIERQLACGAHPQFAPVLYKWPCFAGNYNAPVSKAQAIKTIRTAFENGVTFFDTAAQVSLAWLLAKGSNIVPIPGTRSETHLFDNLGVRRLQLTTADVEEIETKLSRYPVYGDRMGKDHMSSIDYSA